MSWVPSPGAKHLSDLSDVDTSGVTDDQVLRYDSGSGVWLPGDAGSGGGGSNASYAETIGDNTNTSFQVTHDLGTQDLVVQLWDLTGAEPVEATSDADSIEIDDDDNITVTFSVAPATDSYRVVILSSGGKSGGGGGGGGLAPSWVEALAVADSPNASDDEFNDDTIDPAWTEVLVSGNATWTEANDHLTVAYDSQTSGDAAAMLKAIPGTPSAPIEIRAAIRTLGVGNHQAVGLVFAGGTTDASGSVWFRYNLTDSSVGLYGGTLTNLQGSQLRQVSISQRQVPWLHLALRWESANTWAIRFSTDGATWSSFGQADASFTLTPTHFGLAVCRFGGGTPALASFEYFRVV